MIGDVLRWIDVLLALILCSFCAPCVIFSADHWQRARFAVVLGYGVVTVGGQFNALGRPATWVTYVLVVVSAAAVVTTAQFALSGLRTARGGDDGGQR